jgi:1,4-dihydroxy-2-naphthoate octaprenyltransferase
MEVVSVNGNTTSWIVTILGVVVTAIGYLMLPGEFAAGVLGFGLAHIVLGLLDMLRPTVRT